MRRQGTHSVAERAARQRFSGDALIPREAEISAEYKNSAYWMGRCSAIIGHMTSVTMYRRGVSTHWRRVHSRVKFPAAVQLDLPRPRTADERYFGVAYARFKEDSSSWDNAQNLSADLVMMPHPILRCDARGLPVPVGERNERGFVPPKSWLREERKSRHALNLFVAYQHREADYYIATALGDRYTELPNDWHEWEAPYLFPVETPAIVSYDHEALVGSGMEGAAGRILRSQWVANYLRALYLTAVGEGHLYSALQTIQDAWQKMGISEILGGCSPLVVDRCEKLVSYVRRIRWRQVPAKNRILPTKTGTVAPVYDNGDYVEFDVDGWKPMVPAKMLVNTELNSLKERISEGVDRGSRLYGTTEGWMHRHCPQNEGPDVVTRFLRTRPKQVSRSEVDSSGRVLQAYFDKYGYSSLSRKHGLRTIRMDGVMQFIGHCMYRLDPWNPAWEVTQLYRDNL